jgi:exopolysaccharide biosynthesis polyprenyl glycosylphosphotransferase
VGAVAQWLWTRGFRFLVVLDAVALYGAALGINFVRFGTDWPTYPLGHYLVGFAIAVGLQLVVNYFAGLYEREPRIGSRPLMPRVAVAMAIGVAVQGVAYVALDRYLMPRLNLVVLFVVGTLLLTLNRWVSARLADRRRGVSRVVVIGAARAVAVAIDQLAADRRQAEVVDTAATTSGLEARVRRWEATDVLLLDLAGFDAMFPEPLTSLDRRGVGVHQRVSALETMLGLRSVTQIAGMPFTRLRSHSMSAHQLRLKRLFDLVAVIVTLPVTVPVGLCLALWVRLRAGRGVLYRQERVGEGGKVFELVKFRTMVHDAEQAGPQLATRHDPRVVGGLGWMRAMRADELPQLVNVLRGQMSLVGPRPERPELEAAIAAGVPGYARRYELPPGITGMAQVYGRYASSAESKLGYDLQYLVNWSLVLDLEILARTVWVVATRRV